MSQGFTTLKIISLQVSNFKIQFQKELEAEIILKVDSKTRVFLFDICNEETF